MDRFDPAGDMDREMWDRVIAVNLTAPAMITKRAVNGFLKHDTKGVIVNIASIAGTRDFSSGAAYTASKHGILGLTKNTGVYYAPKGIRCNAIMAGAMQTNIGGAFFSGKGLNMEGLATMRKTCEFRHFVCNLWEGGGRIVLMSVFAVPEEFGVTISTEKVAKFVSYLCSDDAEIINGACLTADGAWTAN